MLWSFILSLSLQIVSTTGSIIEWRLIWLGDPGWEWKYVELSLLKYVSLKPDIVYSAKEFAKDGISAIKDYLQDYTIFTLRHMKAGGETSSKEFNEELVEYISQHNLKAILIYPGLEGRLTDMRCTRDDHIRIVEKVPLLIRNYWAFDCFNKPNVVFAPLMIKHPDRNKPHDDIVASTPPVAERTFVWSFYSSGHPTKKRDVIVNNMLTLNSTHPEYVFSLDYRQHQHNCPIARVGPSRRRKKGDMSYETMYHQSLLNSIFGLSPEGNSPETWRFYEILERGAIPIVMESTMETYYRYVFPCNVTQLLVSTTDPAAAVRAMMQDKVVLEKWRVALVSIYNTWRNDWQRNIAARIEAVGSGGAPKLSGLFWDYNSCYLTPGVLHVQHNN